MRCTSCARGLRNDITYCPHCGVKVSTTANLIGETSNELPSSASVGHRKRMGALTFETKAKPVEMLAYVNPDGKLVTSVAMCEPYNSKSFQTRFRAKSKTEKCVSAPNLSKNGK